MYAMRGVGARASGGYHCAVCVEELDRGRTKNNLCFACSRVMTNADVKFVMPSRMLGARLLPMHRRLMCAECYKRFATRSRGHTSSPTSAVSRRLSVAHSLLIRSMRL